MVLKGGFPEPTSKRSYCRKHGIEYSGYRCPQCVQDDKNRRFEEVMKPLRESEQKEEARQSLRSLLARLETAEVVKETSDYKLSVCPVCHKPTLFYYKRTGEYSCLDKRVCGLNSTIRLLTQKGV